MTIPRGLFILLVGMLLGGLLTVCIVFTVLTGHDGWGIGVVFTAIAIWAFWFWTSETED